MKTCSETSRLSRQPPSIKHGLGCRSFVLAASPTTTPRRVGRQKGRRKKIIVSCSGSRCVQLRSDKLSSRTLSSLVEGENPGLAGRAPIFFCCGRDRWGRSTRRGERMWLVRPSSPSWFLFGRTKWLLLAALPVSDAHQRHWPIAARPKTRYKAILSPKGRMPSGNAAGPDSAGTLGFAWTGTGTRHKTTRSITGFKNYYLQD